MKQIPDGPRSAGRRRMDKRTARPENVQGQPGAGGLEEKLREPEQILRPLAENIHEVFWLASADQRQMFYVSPSYENIWGRTCESLVRNPMSWLEAIHPEDRPGIEAQMPRDPGERFTRECRIVRPDGTIRWILARGFSMRDQQGRSDRIAGLAEDITERKRLEQAISKSRSDLEEAQRVARMGSWTFNARTREVTWSDELYRIFGLDKSAFGGTYEAFAACVHPDDRPRVLRANAQARSAGRPFYIEYRIVTPAGDLKVIHEAGRPIKDNEGHVVGLIGTAQDVTERKRAEKRTQVFAQELVAAREEERRRVSSALHHDVGSLAVGISAYLDAIEEDLRRGKPGESLRWLRRTRKLFDKSVMRLKGLAVELRPPELDVLGLRAALRQYFSEITKHRSAQIHFRDTPWSDRVSERAATVLFRVAQEALTNAIRHGRAKRVDVALRTSKEEIKLTIRDNGKGFDVSEQKASVTSQLGLRVMEEMATSVGGIFSVDSHRGKGTTVRLKAPIETPALKLTQSAARKERATEGRTPAAPRRSGPQKGSRA